MEPKTQVIKPNPNCPNCKGEGQVEETVNYYENPTSFGEVPWDSFAKVNRQLVKVVSGLNGRIDLVTPSREEVRKLRDHLAILRDNSPDDWRRWNEVDSHYTSLCIAGVS